MHRYDHETQLGAATRRIGHWLFSERQFIVRSKGRVRCVSMSRLPQVVLSALALIGFAWVTHATVSYFDFQTTIIAKDHEIALGARAYRTLRAEVRDSRRRFLAIAGALEKNQAHLVNLVDQNQTLQGNLTSMQDKLQDSEDERLSSAQRRDFLHSQIAGIETQVEDAANRNASLAGDLETTEIRLSVVLAERSQAEQRGDHLKSRVRRLESRLANVSESQATLLLRITESTVGDIERLRTLIDSTGIGVDRLLARVNRRTSGVGGPFIPVIGGAGGDADGDRFDVGMSVLGEHMNRWETLQRLVRNLPLIPPVDHYYVASRFGRRNDPFNKRWAMHMGLDLAGSSRQPIHAAAPGKVVFAGWAGRFGRLIDIDHGLGVRTRYGHLRKIKVKKGQRVEYRQTIGLLGSSGRSTGPHLHYEVVVDGKQVNPMKFLNAGKNVFKG